MADGTVPLDGGAGIVVDGTPCALTTIGHDNTGELVGFTAASCGAPGSQVTAVGGANIGSVVADEDSPKYAVIKFDPSQVIPPANFAGLRSTASAPTPTSGNRHALTARLLAISAARSPLSLDSDQAEIWPGATLQPGDEGRPVTADNLLIGITYRRWVTTPDLLYRGGNQPEAHVVLSCAILADVNAKGGPGAGFSPVPA